VLGRIHLLERSVEQLFLFVAREPPIANRLGLLVEPHAESTSFSLSTLVPMNRASATARASSFPTSIVAGRSSRAASAGSSRHRGRVHASQHGLRDGDVELLGQAIQHAPRPGAIVRVDLGERRGHGRFHDAALDTVGPGPGDREPQNGSPPVARIVDALQQSLGNQTLQAPRQVLGWMCRIVARSPADNPEKGRPHATRGVAVP
jgi:hypothetical protein